MSQNHNPAPTCESESQPFSSGVSQNHNFWAVLPVDNFNFRARCEPESQPFAFKTENNLPACYLFYTICESESLLSVSQNYNLCESKSQPFGLIHKDGIPFVGSFGFSYKMVGWLHFVGDVSYFTTLSALFFLEVS